MLTIFFYICLIYPTNISPALGIVKDIYWRDYVPGDIPCDAYEGAPGRYIGQMLLVHDASVYHAAATIYPSSNTAVSEYVGKKIAKYDFKILCSPDNSKFYWEYVDFDKPNDLQLKEAVVGGFEVSHNLFIGKVLHEAEWKISKVMPFEYGNNKGLWVWKGEKEAANIHQFFILKYNTTEACLKIQGHNNCSI